MSTLTAKTILAALFLASLCLGQTTARATIPFNFMVGGKLMPAGYYLVKESTGMISLQSDSGDAVVALTHGDTRNSDGPTQLVFHRYGDDTFLSRIWLHGDTGVALQPSKREKQLAKAISHPASTSVALRH